MAPTSTGRLPQAAAILVGMLSVFLAAPFIYSLGLPSTLARIGAFRTPVNTVFPKPEDFVKIDDTTHCEDIHHHAPSNLLFTACEGTEETRYSWFPPLVNYDNPSVALKARGSIHVIDPKTMKSRKLELKKFIGPFVTHGIDVISDPEKPEGKAIYIFAVNHVPNFEYYGEALSGSPPNTSVEIPKSRSQVEIFHHVIGSDTAQHIRSVWDPLMRTTNDIVALSPTSFFITNDHFYKEGFMRQIEDSYVGAKWTNTIHIQLPGLDTVKSATEGVTATVALDKMHNNNGLGHGRSQDEVLVVECDSGRLNVGRVARKAAHQPTIQIQDSMQVDSLIDNPSYFSDPFAEDTYDASIFVLPGLSRAIDLAKNVRSRSGKDPVMVWGAKLIPPSESDSRGKWETRLLFEDDSTRIRSASAAVIVAIPPAAEGGHRRAWLFVTGFMSSNIIAVKIDL